MMSNNNVSKILYFEGAGWDFEPHNQSDVGNYRIRTAFKNLEGVEYYIEIVRTNRFIIGRNGKHKKTSEWAFRVDHLFKIEDRDKELYEIKKDYSAMAELDYTKETIKNWINSNLNCDFDTIEVLTMFHGYHVHGDNRTYNLMDDHTVNHEQAEKRKIAYDKVDMEYRELTSSKYSVIGLLNMDDDSITIRCHASKERISDNARVKKIIIS